MYRYVAPLLIAVFSLCAAVLAAEDVGIRAPDGFEVTLYAGDDLAHDIYSMTIDSRGRVVVAGQGYVKILHDEDNDGKAEKAKVFSEFPKSGAHGMVFVGNDLIATGDNLLMRLKDEDGNGVADGKPIPLANVRSPEHGANGLVHGPDGWIYMICGNDAGVGAQLARTKTSPVKKPQAGAVVRFSPDFKTSEIFADGFRNPYDLTFNANGHLFTVDADGERDQYLPWYTPTRLFDIQQGMHHGWVQRGWTRSWNRPECFFDNVERLVEVGRGSPTGMECYRHYAFPKHYRGGIYSCCWTLGTVYYFPLVRDGATYKSEKEIFLQTTGDVGFAPVDLAVGPDGDMFVAIGGRGTRGSVFRVRYTGALKKEEQYVEKKGLVGILNAPQPLSAWSRVKWMPLAKKLDKEDFERAAAANEIYSTSERIRALEILAELHDGISEKARLAVEHSSLFVDKNYEVLARTLWSAGHAADDEDVRKYAVSLFSPFHEHEPVSRAAWETLARFENPLPALDRRLWESATHQPPRVQSAALQVAGDSRVDPEKGELSDIKSPEARSAILQYRAMHGLLQPEDFDEVLKLLDPDNRVSSVEQRADEFFVAAVEDGGKGAGPRRSGRR